MMILDKFKSSIQAASHSGYYEEQRDPNTDQFMKSGPKEQKKKEGAQ